MKVGTYSTVYMDKKNTIISLSMSSRFGSLMKKMTPNPNEAIDFISQFTLLNPVIS